jgi:hypothetical protein
MPANKSWARWIKASVSKHFDDRKEDVHLFIENQHRDTDEVKEFIELRVDGPRCLEVSKDCWKIRVEINLLIQVVMNDKDYHRIDDIVGIVQAAFTNSIPVYRYGNRTGDDDTFLGCLRILMDPSTRDFLEANRFGQIDIRTKLLQSTVEGHYEMDLQT